MLIAAKFTNKRRTLHTSQQLNTAICLFFHFVRLCRRPRLFGYVMTFVGYSTWTGKVLQIKDFFVSAPARSLGVGQAMFRAVGEHAVRGGYERLDYYVFNWNKRAIRFYEQLGAVDVTVADQWNMYRIPLLK